MSVKIATRVHAESPGGAPFIIDRARFVPGGQIDVSGLDLAEDRLFNWPMVYILANDDEAYVGQTTSVVSRMGQHGANPEKKSFTTVNVIYNEEFNASVITDYEHRLIGYMHGDGRYRLTNKNDGMTDTNYFSKARYASMFDDLWNDLRRLDLADHTIEEIEESEVFKYSPYKGLTVDQRVALDKIMEAIEAGLENAKPIVVQGMPGTGKTILAIYLLKMLKDDPRYADLNVRIVEPVASLRTTLKKSLKGVSGMSGKDIIGPADIAKKEFGWVPGKKKCFDIVLVDEAHRLKRRVNLGSSFRSFDDVNRKLGFGKESTQMDWILDQAKLPVFFYDPLQAVGPSCLNPVSIRETLGSSIDAPISLDSQMRVKGGKEYLDYVEGILSGADEPPRRFSGYEFLLHEDFDEFAQSFERTLAEHDLSRMLAGYAWKWMTNPKKTHDPDRLMSDINIGSTHLRWNCTYDNWVGKGVDDPRIAHEVGCIHSIQGYDLSYAYVILGPDIRFDSESGKIVADKAHYCDRNGYATATPKELNRYIKNIYYVLLTRGIYGTHVYVCDRGLRELFKRYVPSA